MNLAALTRYARDGLPAHRASFGRTDLPRRCGVGQIGRTAKENTGGRRGVAGRDGRLCDATTRLGGPASCHDARGGPARWHEARGGVGAAPESPHSS